MTTIIEAAKECLGTPFKHQARLPGIGIDCVGLIVHVFKRLGLEYQDHHGYARSPFDGELERQLDAQPSLQRIPTHEADEGDMLLMRIASSPQHVAIHAGRLNGNPYIIHSSEEHGGVVHHRLDSLWGARVMRAYKFRISP